MSTSGSTAQRSAARRLAPAAGEAGPPRNVVPLYRAHDLHSQATICRACAIRSEALFGALDDAALDRIHVHIAELHLQPDEPLRRRGDAFAIFTVRSGIVRAERVTARGDCRIVRLVGPGTLVGQEALLGRAADDEWRACTPVQACRIPTALVQELMRSEAALGQELMQRWQRALDETETWLADVATGPARRRVVRLLQLLLALGDGDRVWLPKRSEMGAMLDVTIETASRQISALRREGVLPELGIGHARVSSEELERALHDADAA